MWLLVATVAQIILGSSAVFDKLLITRRSIDPLVYAFWIGIIGAGAFFLLPFGFQSVSLSLIFASLLSGVFFIYAFIFLFRTLSGHEATELFPLVGAISPVLTLLFAAGFLGAGVRGGSLFGFLFLILGGFFIYWAERKQFRKELIGGAILASIFFALSYVLAKLVFQETNFITGFFWTKMGGVVFALSMLHSAPFREKIFHRKGAFGSGGNVLWYFLNRAYAALGSVFVSYAVFLAHPALVDATQNIKYIAIFIAAGFLTRERFLGRALAKKIAALVFIGIGLLWLAAEEYARSLPLLSEYRAIHWGVTYSPKFARQLGLDWKESFSAIVDELRPEHVRLIAYWDDIEKTRDTYDFSELDWQLARLETARPEVILALGMKVPRWPECHIPAWARGLSTEAREAELRAYMRDIVARYKKNPLIRVWQVENEPYLMFGQCPAREADFVKQEINLVKSIDPTRPAMTTDGGEFGLWFRAAREADIFGTTMYRKVYPRFIIGPLFGTVEYPLSPRYFRLKERIVRQIIGDNQKRFLVGELQAEPWGERSIQELSYEEQIQLFSPEYFRETIQYAKDAGFDEYYLWGAEWWYFLKTRYNDDRIWEEAKVIMRH